MGAENIKDIYNIQKQIIEARRAQGGLKSDESIIWIPIVINIYALPSQCDDQGDAPEFGTEGIPNKKWWYNLVDIINLIFAGEYEGQGPDITSLGLRWDDDDNYVKAVSHASHGVRSRIRFAIAPNDDTGSDFTTSALNIIPILKALENVPYAVPMALEDKTSLPGSGGYTPMDVLNDYGEVINKYIDNQGVGLDDKSLSEYLKANYNYQNFFNPGGKSSRDKFFVLNFAKQWGGLAGSAQFPGEASNKIVFINLRTGDSNYGQNYADETFDGKFVATIAHEIGHALGLWHNFDHPDRGVRNYEEQIFLNTYFKESLYRATKDSNNDGTSDINAATQNLFNIIPNNIHLLYLKSSTYEHTESNVLFEDSIMHDPSDNSEDNNYVPEFHFDNLLQRRQEYEPYVGTGYALSHRLRADKGWYVMEVLGKIPTLKRFAKVDVSDILDIDMSSFRNIVCAPISEYHPSYEENNPKPSNVVNAMLFKIHNDNPLQLDNAALHNIVERTYGIVHDDDYDSAETINGDNPNPFLDYPKFIAGTTVETLFSEENCPCLYTKHSVYGYSGLQNRYPLFFYREDNTMNNAYLGIPGRVQAPNFYFPTQTIGGKTFSNNVLYSPQTNTTPAYNVPNNNSLFLPTDDYITSSFTFSSEDFTYNDFIGKFKDPSNLSVTLTGGSYTNPFTATYGAIVNHIHNVYASVGYHLTSVQRKKFETYITDYVTQISPGKVRAEFYGNLHASLYGAYNVFEVETYDSANVEPTINNLFSKRQIPGNWYDLDSNPYDIYMTHVVRYSREALRDYTNTGNNTNELQAGQLSNPAGLFSPGGERLTKSKLIQRSLETFGRYPLNNTGDSTMSWSSIFNIMNYTMYEPYICDSTLNGNYYPIHHAKKTSFIAGKEKLNNEAYTSNTTFSPYQLLMMEYNILKGDHGFNELTSFSATLQTSGWPTNTMEINQDPFLCKEGLQADSTPYYQYYFIDGELQTEGPYNALEENFYSIGNDLVDTSGNFYNGVFSYNPSTTELLDVQGNKLYSLASAVQENIDLNLGETFEKMKKFSAIYNKIVNFTN